MAILLCESLRNLFGLSRPLGTEGFFKSSLEVTWEIVIMTKPKIIQFSCPAPLVEQIDRIAREEMLPRASVIRRALQWEARAVGDVKEIVEASEAGSPTG